MTLGIQSHSYLWVSSPRVPLPREISTSGDRRQEPVPLRHEPVPPSREYPTPPRVDYFGYTDYIQPEYEERDNRAVDAFIL